MKNLLKTMVVGTFVEPLARKVHSFLMLERGNQSTSVVDDRACLYDIQTIDVMNRVLTKDSNCIDVGCHVGSILREILNLSPEGTHFVFEPLPELYKGLLKEFGSIESLRIHDCALSDAAGVTSFQHVS